MTYQIELSPSALADAEKAYLWYREHDKQFADRWFQGLMKAVMSLEKLPARCAIAQESRDLDREVRHLVYRCSNTTYRVFFGISNEQDTVHVYRIRHTAQQPLSKTDFDY